MNFTTIATTRGFGSWIRINMVKVVRLRLSACERQTSAMQVGTRSCRSCFPNPTRCPRNATVVAGLFQPDTLATNSQTLWLLWGSSQDRCRRTRCVHAARRLVCRTVSGLVQTGILLSRLTRERSGVQMISQILDRLTIQACRFDLSNGQVARSAPVADKLSNSHSILFCHS